MESPTHLDRRLIEHVELKNNDPTRRFDRQVVQLMRIGRVSGGREDSSSGVTSRPLGYYPRPCRPCQSNFATHNLLGEGEPYATIPADDQYLGHVCVE